MFQESNEDILPIPFDESQAYSAANLDIYYEYHNIGELVEVEHEEFKYWIGNIVYKYKNLVLIRWVCNCGEQWLDTSVPMQNILITDKETQISKDIERRHYYPPGYFLQLHLSMLFQLERPKDITKSLLKDDPYANVISIDDLISFEPQEQMEIDPNENCNLATIKLETINKDCEDDDMLSKQCLDIQKEAFNQFKQKLNTKIYFNSKCFTGPSLSKSKILAAPISVGPGPFRLVTEEVVSKIISVAYVPPRILNDLSSKAFRDLLVSRGVTNTVSKTFKAKYQKKVQRESLQVIIDPNDLKAFCECMCEHLKCCYNLFGPDSYDGDDCPSHCRTLTKSNKFMKRATYYREKARLGEFSLNEGSKKSVSTPSSRCKTVDQGRNINFNSNISSSRSKSDNQANVDCFENGSQSSQIELRKHNELGCLDETSQVLEGLMQQFEKTKSEVDVKPRQSKNSMILDKKQLDIPLDDLSNDPLQWSVDDVSTILERSNHSKWVVPFKKQYIDGPAFLLLDNDVLTEHFLEVKRLEYDYTQAEIDDLSQFVESFSKKIKTFGK